MENITHFTIRYRFFAMIKMGNIFSGLKDFKINSKTTLDEVLAYLLFDGNLEEAKNIQTCLLNQQTPPVIRGFIKGSLITELTHLEQTFTDAFDIWIEDPEEIEEEELKRITEGYQPMPLVEYCKNLTRESFRLTLLDKLSIDLGHNLDLITDALIESIDREAEITPQKEKELIKTFHKL